ncbi:GNAT family N-acetyltransferase [Radiobacillus deserti]|uniref:GNAT family N-acetyltransferase n=1 Tax=Radiobacillus deserti TaxID=2594883 RepID=A0A516KF95_9BACI|nr:GNAT family N-acetyltransferase [Radiobacillus deserti]QDP40063.1 GNAT family N-acetyltransferase [Radiobacillus deserti]
MEIKELTSSEFDSAIDLGEYAFNRAIPEQERKERKADMEQHKVLGYWEGDQLAAKLHIRPLEAFLGSKKIPFGGIAGVATWPEFRRQGKVDELIREALRLMKGANQSISLLHPFSIGFYRRFGWEMTQYEHTYLFKPTDIEKRKAQCRTERVKFSDMKPILMDLYERKAQQYGLTLARTEWWWEKRILTGDEQIVLFWNDNREAEGYLISRLEKAKLQVEEMVFFTESAFHGLLQWVRNHDSMIERVEMVSWPDEWIDFYLEGEKVDRKVHPYFMTRIVNVSDFLLQYPFFHPEISCSIGLSITDPCASWNEGKWSLDIKKGKVVEVLKKENFEAPLKLELSIQVLTAWLLGSQSIDALQRMNQIKASGDKQVLPYLVKPLTPAFMDFF